MAAKKKEISMEEMLRQVDQIIKDLQTGELSFEENLAAYQRGTEFLKECGGRLEKAEKELIVLEVDEI